MKYFISDLHIDHPNIIRLANRPFNNIKEMQDTLIANINNAVSKDDELYILGDLCLGKKPIWEAFLDRINCNNLHLIVGNHDKKPAIPINRFTSISNLLSIKVGDLLITMSHYPMRYHWFRRCMGYLLGKPLPKYFERFPLHHKGLHIHGHTHSYTFKNGRQFNVGCEAINYTPVSLESILKRIGAKTNGVIQD